MNNKVIIQNYQKNNFINSEIYKRNIPTAELNAQIPFRPVNTKYTHMPILDNRKQSSVALVNNGVYDVSDTFFPGSRNTDFSGFATNVDKESTLRNQFFALQKSDLASWIPSSTSDLYTNPINFKNINRNVDNLLLFKDEQFNDFNPNLSQNIGNNFFNNSTRVQLKNL